MTATLGGKERELTVEEALQQQTLKDALADKRMAIRKVLKMIEKREAALTKKNPPAERHGKEGSSPLCRQRQRSDADPGHSFARF